MNEQFLPVRALRSAHCRVQSAYIEMQMKKSGLGHARSIHTFTTRAELEALFYLTRSKGPNSTVVEIGSYLGASTCYIAGGLRPNGGRIVCIDTWENQTMPDGIRDTYKEFSDHLKPVWELIAPIRVRSDTLTPDDLPNLIDLAFIDGDHSYTAASSDFALLSSRIQLGGTVVFHDTRIEVFDGPTRVVGEALASGRWKLCGLQHSLAWISRFR